MTDVLIKKGNLDTETDTHTGRTSCDREGRGGVIGLQAKECLGEARREGQGADSPSQPSEGANPADTLILNFWSQDLQDRKFLLFKSPSLGTLLPQKTSEAIQ